MSRRVGQSWSPEECVEFARLLRCLFAARPDLQRRPLALKAFKKVLRMEERALEIMGSDDG